MLADNSDITVAKVSDFGLAKLVDAKTMMKTFCGTPMYVAPEILNNLGRNFYTNQVCISMSSYNVINGEEMFLLNLNFFLG